METPFTILLTKGETGQCSTPGLFQDATMRCVKREEKKTAMSSQQGFLVDGMCVFTVHSNPEIELKELKQHQDEPQLHTSRFDFIYQYTPSQTTYSSQNGITNARHRTNASQSPARDSQYTFIHSNQQFRL